MSLLLQAQLLLALIFRTRTQDLCLWYSLVDLTQLYNGLYIKQSGDYGGYPYYYKQVPGNCGSSGGPLDTYVWY